MGYFQEYTHAIYYILNLHVIIKQFFKRFRRIDSKVLYQDIYIVLFYM